MARLSITVEYCASCDYLPRALWMAGEVLKEIQFEVERFALLPGDRGVFEWRVGDEVVFSKGESGRFPELEELKEAIYARLDG
jgi:selenoprotein W-related protein